MTENERGIKLHALLLDIGNSRIKWGVLEDGVVGNTGDITHASILEQGMPALISQLPRHVDAAFASNVAGTSFSEQISAAVHARYDCELQFAESEQRSNGVSNNYVEPSQLGVDRWVAMIGARADIKTCCVVVDVGTAITIDVLNHDGQHLGGQILPGLRLMSESLSNQTSDIKCVDVLIGGGGQGLNMFANNTDDAIIQGARNAVLGAIERSTSVLASAGHAATTILTGGDAPKILPLLSEETLHRPHLVLQGLAHILLSRS
jgi:type III pantothenate kinase